MTKQTNRIQSLAAVAAGLLFAAGAVAQTPILPPTITLTNLSDFGEYREPMVVGERTIAVTVFIGSVSRGDVTVTLTYADSLAALAGTPSRAQASCAATNSGGIIRCTAILPHAVHPQPNILTVDEILGLEPPSVRPTRFDLAGSSNLVVTDFNPRTIARGKTVFYQWSKLAPNGRIKQVTADIQRSFVMPREYTMANLGDSYAAGEGAPNRSLVRTVDSLNGLLDNGRANQFSSKPMWDDFPCHQSGVSGQNKAVADLRNQSPQFAMEFNNFACAGAEIQRGLIDTQRVEVEQALDPQLRRNSHPVDVPSQLDRLAAWLNDRPLDMMVLNIGGNDAGFGKIGETCLINGALNPFSNLAGCRFLLADTIASSLALTRTRYGSLADTIRARNIDVRDGVMTGYPDPTHDKNGVFCGPAVGLAEACWGVLERKLDQADFRFIHDSFVVPLNTAAQNFATSMHFTFLDLTAVSATKGICNCGGGFFNTVGQSDEKQGDLFGSIHPNQRGYDNMHWAKILAQLQHDVPRAIAIERAKALAAAR